jgi:tetratricopeptide (TPR) repeat protein
MDFMRYSLSIALNRLDQAKANYRQAFERKLDHPFFHYDLYGIAFLQNDAVGMAQQVAWSAGKRGVEDVLLGVQADTAAYSGRLNNPESFPAGRWIPPNGRKRRVRLQRTPPLLACGKPCLATQKKLDGAPLCQMERSAGRGEQYGAALALAYVGDDGRGLGQAEDLGKKFPEDTLLQFNYLPTLRARLAVSRGNASEALETLKTAEPYELGSVPVGGYVWLALYPVFVRGEAYLAAHQGKEAAADFQKILDHRGIVVNEPIGALAHFGLTRAYVMQGDTAKAHAAYQDFLTLWKDANPDIPIFKEAKAEYAKLQ